jgi:hypothetical protein
MDVTPDFCMRIMNLNIIIDQDTREFSISAEMMEDAQGLFTKMDSDMDNGWQLGKSFIASPTSIQRCQIIANRLLTALHTQNLASATLMSAYILHCLPTAYTVNLNTEGEADETQFYDQNNSLIR